MWRARVATHIRILAHTHTNLTCPRAKIHLLEGLIEFGACADMQQHTHTHADSSLHVFTLNPSNLTFAKQILELMFFFEVGNSTNNK